MLNALDEVPVGEAIDAASALVASLKAMVKADYRDGYQRWRDVGSATKTAKALSRKAAADLRAAYGDLPEASVLDVAAASAAHAAHRAFVEQEWARRELAALDAVRIEKATAEVTRLSLAEGFLAATRAVRLARFATQALDTRGMLGSALDRRGADEEDAAYAVRELAFAAHDVDLPCQMALHCLEHDIMAAGEVCGRHVDALADLLKSEFPPGLEVEPDPAPMRRLAF